MENLVSLNVEKSRKKDGSLSSSFGFSLRKMWLKDAAKMQIKMQVKVYICIN